MRRPTQDVRCSFGLSGAGWTAQDRFDSARGVSDTVDALQDHVDLMSASLATRAGA